jgi:hypothetical protein
MADILQALKRLLKESENIVAWQQEIYTALHNIDAAWVTTGTFDVARIPDLDASKITSGVFDVARIPGLDASKIISGTFDVARIPNLDASKITSGRFPLARLPTSATANRFLVVRTANADPVYDALVAGDIPSITRSKISDFWGTPFWGNIPDKPSTFPPSAHTHARSDVTDFWSSPFWGNIPDKPSTFPPSAHASSHEYGGSDLVRNLDYLAIRGTTVITSGRVLQNIASVAQTLLPDADNTRALGSSSYRWSDVRTALLNGWNPDAHASRHASGGADAVSLDASQITSGRLGLSRIPTSATANRVLLVRTANADPTYDQVNWNTDIKNIPSSFPPSAHASTHEYGGTDLVRNLDYLAIRGTTVIDSSRNAVNLASVKGARLIVTDQIRDSSDAYQMAKIVPSSGTTRNTPAFVFFPATSDWSLLPTSAGWGFIGEEDRYWFKMYSSYYYYKTAPTSFSCPSKLKEVPLDRALSVKVEEKKLSKGLKVRYKAPTPHSEDAYTVKDLIRGRLGFNMAPLEREYTKHLLQKHNGDFESALREAKEFFGEELDSYGRPIKERLEKKMPIDDEVALDELVSVYGEQAVAEALEILKFELHDQIEVA